MITDIELRTDPRTAASPLALQAMASTRLGIDANRIRHTAIVRRSIDARQRRVMVGLTLRLWIDEDPPAADAAGKPELFAPLPPDAPQAVVVGAGPAGLFAALRLIQLGVRPVVLERGKDVDSRRLDLAAISRTSTVDPDSNYCFGEGGAGTYSDGKLFTRSKKRGNTGRILNILWQHGADPSILVDAHPHIGSDRLPVIIKAIRHTIEQCGGRVLFGTKVTGLIIDAAGAATGVTTAGGTTYGGRVILATGHSARDTYRMLLAGGVAMEPKGIAVGVRLEHPQQLIDCIRYHNPQGRGKYLPPAEYTLLTRVDGRAVYSFCMCPGGVIVPAASAPGELVVNGMSASARGSRWANSGMVVELLPEDAEAYAEQGPLRMMELQADIERRFFRAGDGSQKAPAQRMTDFVAARPSASLPPSSYAPGIYPARVDALLSEAISGRLRKAFEEFGRKQHGFLTADATVVGNETRTSSPVRLPRDPATLQSVSTPGLYPAGEGAGYAGGIVSAAVDGERAAEALAAALGLYRSPQNSNITAP